MDTRASLRNAGLDTHYATISIGWGVVLSILTCGIYSLVWNYRQMKIMNALLDEERFSFWKWFFLSLLTCGIYAMYYEYKMGEGLEELQEKYEVRVNESLSLIALIVSLFATPIAADAILQEEINKLVS